MFIICKHGSLVSILKVSLAYWIKFTMDNMWQQCFAITRTTIPIIFSPIDVSTKQ